MGPRRLVAGHAHPLLGDLPAVDRHRRAGVGVAIDLHRQGAGLFGDVLVELLGVGAGLLVRLGVGEDARHQISRLADPAQLEIGRREVVFDGGGPVVVEGLLESRGRRLPVLVLARLDTLEEELTRLLAAFLALLGVSGGHEADQRDRRDRKEAAHDSRVHEKGRAPRISGGRY